VADVELLAAVDEAHETLSGPATRRILEREYQQYGKQEYVRLASISVPHLYNLRRHPGYRQRRLNYVKTKPTEVTIAERRCPDPQGRPGYEWRRFAFDLPPLKRSSNPSAKEESKGGYCRL
jgi:hypothetical protein